MALVLTVLWGFGENWKYKQADKNSTLCSQFYFQYLVFYILFKTGFEILSKHLLSDDIWIVIIGECWVIIGERKKEKSLDIIETTSEKKKKTWSDSVLVDVQCSAVWSGPVFAYTLTHAQIRHIFWPKGINIFLISPWKHMFWVLIRSTLARHF